MSSCNQHKKKETVTSGPVYVAPVNSFFLVFPLPNNKVVVTLKNPTHKKLEAQVTLGICKQCDLLGPPAATPDAGLIDGLSSCVQKVKALENEINLGWHEVKPMSCLRLEKFFNDYELGNTVIRISARGDFNVDPESNTLIGGLLEISSVAGFFYAPIYDSLNLSPEAITALQSPWISSLYSGLTTADASTFVSFGDYVVVKHPSQSHSSSSSSSSSDY
ncbi:hypothetical protein D3C73_570310 [compost metagenome]